MTSVVVTRNFQITLPKIVRRGLGIVIGDSVIIEERKNEVVEQVTAAVLQATEGKEEIATSELREKILSELDGVEPSVSAAWREYDQEKEGK